MKLCLHAELVFDYSCPGAPRASASVAPIVVGPDSIYYSMKGKEVCVELHTERHNTYPLIIRGAGAGGIEGCAGVIGDVMMVAKALQGKGSFY